MTQVSSNDVRNNLAAGPAALKAHCLSVVTPAYNESRNLPVLHERLCQVLDGLNESLNWEWIIVDDHSSDETFQVVKELASKDPRVRGMRLARNCGSHAAITCGLQHGSGDCAVVLAADLQDPPEVLPKLVNRWNSGAQIVWAYRERREGESISTRAFARFYYFIMRHIVGIRELPATGADFFLLDRRVVETLLRLPESNTNVLALLTWMGFRQDRIPYVKQGRLYGTSGWSLGKKIKLVVDSITAFTYLPIRMMSYGGLVIALAGFAYALRVIINAFTGTPVEGWSSLMVVTLVMGGTQMLMMGVLGEYLWRALAESRRRPRYILEDSTFPYASIGKYAD